MLSDATCQHVQQNSKNRTDIAQRNARYNINLQLSYIRVRHQYHPITFPAFSPLPSSLTVIFCVHGWSIRLRTSNLASAYFLLAQLIQICSPQFCKLFMQTISSQVHWQKKEPNQVALILHTSNQVQLCFSDHLVSCPWDYCCSGICHGPGKKSIRLRMCWDNTLRKWEIEY